MGRIRSFHETLARSISDQIVCRSARSKFFFQLVSEKEKVPVKISVALFVSSELVGSVRPKEWRSFVVGVKALRFLIQSPVDSAMLPVIVTIDLMFIFICVPQRISGYIVWSFKLFPWCDGDVPVIPLHGVAQWSLVRATIPSRCSCRGGLPSSSQFLPSCHLFCCRLALSKNVSPVHGFFSLR